MNRLRFYWSVNGLRMREMRSISSPDRDDLSNDRASESRCPVSRSRHSRHDRKRLLIRPSRSRVPHASLFIRQSTPQDDSIRRHLGI